MGQIDTELYKEKVGGFQVDFWDSRKVIRFFSDRWTVGPFYLSTYSLYN